MKRAALCLSCGRVSAVREVTCHCDNLVGGHASEKYFTVDEHISYLLAKIRYNIPLTPSEETLLLDTAHEEHQRYLNKNKAVPRS